MTQTEQWDAIVVGSGLGGLSAAAYLAAAGRRTLVLERHSVLGGSSHVFRRKNEWEFDCGVHYQGNCGPGGDLPTLMRGLGLDDRIEWLPLDADGHDTVVAPDFELKLPTGWDNLLANLIEAFPGEERALRRWVGVHRRIGEAFDRSDTPGSLRGVAKLVLDTRTAAPWINVPAVGLMAACGLSPRAMLVLSVMLGAIGSTPIHTPVVAQSAVLQNFVGGGAWYPKGGGQIFSAAFAEVITSHGGALRTGAEVEKILVEGGAVQGVRLTSGEIFRADVVVSDADLKRTISDLVGPEHLPALWRTRFERGKMAWPLINGFFGVEIDGRVGPNTNTFAIPSWDDAGSRLGLKRLGDDTLMRPGNDPVAWARTMAARQPTFVQCSTRRDPSNLRSAPLGHAAIEAQTLAPADPRLWGFDGHDALTPGYRKEPLYREIKEIVLQGLLDRVEQAYPGASAKVVWSELGSPATQTRFTATTAGSAYGLEPTFWQIGPMRPRAETPVRGLLLAGTSTAWGPGTEGAMLSGVHAASAAVGRDLYAEVRAGAVVADPSRLTSWSEDFDPLLATRHLGGATETPHDLEAAVA